MRIAAALIVLLCGWIIGLRRSRALKVRAESLSEIMLMLNNFSIEIRCSGLTPDELMSREEGRFAMAFRACRADCANAREAWERACSELPKKSEEAALLSEFGRLLGTMDRDGTLKTIELYSAKLAALRSAAEETYSRKGKAMVRVGALCGAAAAILII